MSVDEDMFPCKVRANTPEFRYNYDEIFGKKKSRQNRNKQELNRTLLREAKCPQK